MSHDIRKLIEEVLERGYLMSLGTVDDGGVWVADVIYVHDENLNLYWLSLPDARHSRALGENNGVACTITSAWETGKERALQIEGVAERATGEMFELEKNLQTKRGMAPSAEAGEVLRKGHMWYVLKPTKIELIHNELFGYDKQTLEI